MVKFLIDIIDNKYFLNSKKDNIVVTWTMLLIIFFLIFLNIAFNYKYEISDKYVGYIKKIEDEFKVVLYVLESEVSNLSKSSLLVDSLKYDFSIDSISHEYYIIENEKYYEVILDVELSDSYLIENNIINIVMKKDVTTIYNEFKKGMKQWLN